MFFHFLSQVIEQFCVTCWSGIPVYLCVAVLLVYWLSAVLLACLAKCTLAKVGFEFWLLWPSSAIQVKPVLLLYLETWVIFTLYKAIVLTWSPRDMIAKLFHTLSHTSDTP